MGLLEIGYHLIIDRLGGIHRIRDVLLMGCHTPGYNHTSVGVCLLGGLDENGNHRDTFTEPQLDSLRRIGKAFLKEWPHAQIKGHRELPGYMVPRYKCPSLDMDAFRASLDAWPEAQVTLSELTAGRSKAA